MERDRARRYASAAALAADLEACATGRPIAARPVPITGKIVRWARREPRQAMLVAMQLVAMIALALFAGTWWASRDEVQAAERVTRDIERDQALATGYYKLQENSDGEREFLQALALDPQNLEALAGRALVEVQRKHEPAALDLLARAPTSPGFEALRSLCRKEPITQDTACLESQGASALDLFLVGVSLSRQADRGPLSQKPADQKRALRMLDEAVVRSPVARPLIHTARAIAASDARDERATRSAVAALVALWPDSGQTMLAAGTALYHFDLRAAVPLLERATKLAPTDPAPFQVLGNVHQNLGDPEASEAWLWRALDLRRDGETYNSLGISYATRGCIDEALSAWWCGVAIDADTQDCWLNLGQGYYVSEKFEEARACFEHLLTRDPHDLQAIACLGMVLRYLGDFEGSRAYLCRLVERDPQHIGFWADLAQTDLALGAQVEARYAVEAGLALSPNDAELIGLREKLDRE